ncbi:SDR family NAD(P)-dependent oxidoreductase [Halomarina oriensis]|uniref:SDR family NAD(P)-dependent oxidoreductase n=1 Tax=Halomarina oriensis TaxID=671145 RepID=A0A6B0GJU3_9EURY|nr:SDR family oxidoreductase [Halomarina oriensis]MWG33669.1 SDR family NAD(P)-dependent oxidoreductase [Halomarina oriensis]
MDATTVVVTGASRGLGEAVARRFAEEGAHVVLCARDADAVESVAESIREEGDSATGLRADVRDEFDVERLMEVAAREGEAGGVDTVVANAGVYHGETAKTPLAEDAYSAFDQHYQTNGRGVFAAVKEALPHLNDDARILVPSGSVAVDATPGLGSYAASKAFAEALVRQFAVELDATVGVVDPGQLATELTGGAGRDPTDVADQFLWAATEAPTEDLDGGRVDLKTWKRATH